MHPTYTIHDMHIHLHIHAYICQNQISSSVPETIVSNSFFIFFSYFLFRNGSK